MTDARARDRDDDESGAGSPAGGGTATMRSGTGRAAARPERTQAPNGKAPDRKAPDLTAPVSPAAGPTAAAGRRRQAVVDRGTDRPDERMRLRPVIEHLRPEVDGGRFPAKAAVGDDVVVGADVFADGHDLVACELRVRRSGTRGWTTLPMTPLGNDRWEAAFPVTTPGRVDVAVRAWIDRVGTWQRDLRLRDAAGQDVRRELLVGEELLWESSRGASAADRTRLQDVATLAGSVGRDASVGDDPLAAEVPDGTGTLGALLLGEELHRCAGRARPRDPVTSDSRAIVVEAELARYGSWYELFPRSASPTRRDRGPWPM